MKAPVLRSTPSPGRPALRVEEVPRPNLIAGHLLLRVLACGVCRTDLHIFEGDLPLIHEPLIPGHQIVGEVVQGAPAELPLGSRVGVSWVGSTDGTCPYCLRGTEHLSANPTFTGYTLDGRSAEYTLPPSAFTNPLPTGLA